MASLELYKIYLETNFSINISSSIMPRHQAPSALLILYSVLVDLGANELAGIQNSL